MMQTHLKNTFADFNILHAISGESVRLVAIEAPRAPAATELLLDASEDSLSVVESHPFEAASTEDAWIHMADRCAERKSQGYVPLTFPVVFTRGEERQLLFPPTTSALVWQASDGVDSLRAKVFSNRLVAHSAFNRRKDQLLGDGWRPALLPSWSEVSAAHSGVDGWEERSEPEDGTTRHYFVSSSSGKEVGPELRDGEQFNLQSQSERVSPITQVDEDKVLFFTDEAGMVVCDRELNFVNHQKFIENGLTQAIFAHEGAWQWLTIQPWGRSTAMWALTGSDGVADSFLCFDEHHQVAPNRFDELLEATDGAKDETLIAEALPDALNPKRRQWSSTPLGAFVVLMQAQAKGVSFDTLDRDGNHILDVLAQSFAKAVDSQSGDVISNNKRTLLRCIQAVLGQAIDFEYRSGPQALPIGVTVAAALRGSLSEGIIMDDVANQAMALSEELLGRVDLTETGVLWHLAPLGLGERCLDAGAEANEALAAALRCDDLGLAKAALDDDADPNAYLCTPWVLGDPVAPIFGQHKAKLENPEWRSLLEAHGLNPHSRMSTGRSLSGNVDPGAAEALQGTGSTSAFATHVWNSHRGFQVPENAPPSSWDEATLADMRERCRKMNLEERPSALVEVARFVPAYGRTKLSRADKKSREERLAYAQEAAAFLVDEAAVEIGERDAFRSLCWIGAEEQVRTALRRGADATEGLYNAVHQGHDEIVELLLEAGADPNGVPNLGQSNQVQLWRPLTAVRSKRSYEALRERGARLDAQVRAYLLSEGHAFNKKALLDDCVRIASLVVDETGWRQGRSTDGRFFGAKSFVRTEAAFREAAAGVLAKKTTSKVKSGKSESAERVAFVCAQAPFRALRLASPDHSLAAARRVACSEPRVASASRDQTIRIEAENIHRVTLSSAEASRVARVLGTNFEGASIGVFEGLSGDGWAAKKPRQGKVVGTVVRGQFAVGDDEVAIETLNWFAPGEWEPLRMRLDNGLAKGPVSVELMEFQGMELKVSSMSQFQAIEVDQKTKDAIDKCLGRTWETFDVLAELNRELLV